MQIAIHAFHGITAFHLAAPLLVFGEVARRGLAPDWRTTVWGDDGAAIRTAEGLRIDGIAGPETAEAADILVFPSWPTDLAPPPEKLLAVIRRAHTRGATIVGLCLGAVPVAASGVLDGRPATTHWIAAEAIAHEYPRVPVQDRALYIDHGDVLTSAGTASAIDACLHLVRERLGAAAATTIARHLVVAPHREGDQAQYAARQLPATTTEPIGETLAWALAHLDRQLTVEVLAAHARMSPRNFARRFREIVGTTPARWVLARRLDEARTLLERTSWSIARVSASCGFASPVTFRQNFVARFATTPSSYRQRFA